MLFTNELEILSRTCLQSQCLEFDIVNYYFKTQICNSELLFIYLHLYNLQLYHGK